MAPAGRSGSPQSHNSANVPSDSLSIVPPLKIPNLSTSRQSALNATSNPFWEVTKSTNGISSFSVPTVEPSKDSCGVSNHNTARRNILCDHTARPDDRVLADR